jgi:hypothetical protein
LYGPASGWHSKRYGQIWGTLIAFDRFDAPIPGVRLPIMLLYWLGQWGIAASAVRGCGTRRGPGLASRL